MLKILKHEFLAVGKILGIVYGAAITLTALYNLSAVAVSGEYISAGLRTSVLSIGQLLNIIAIPAAIVITGVVLSFQFNNAMFEKSAYYTYSLPVKKHVPLVARLLNTFIFGTFASITYFLQALFIDGVQNFSFASFNIPLGIFTFISIELMYFGVIMSFYAAMTLSERFSDHKIPGVIIFAYLLNMLTFVVGLFIFVPVGLSFYYIISYSVKSRSDAVAWAIYSVMAVYGVLNSVFYYCFFIRKKIYQRLHDKKA